MPPSDPNAIRWWSRVIAGMFKGSQMAKTVTVTKEQTSRRPLLDYGDAAEYTGLREKYLRRLVAEKRIPHVKMSPGRTGRIFSTPTSWTSGSSQTPSPRTHDMGPNKREGQTCSETRLPSPQHNTGDW